MKKVFLIILIAFLCVIGALGLGIGGMYLFGGFNEKIVYAEEIHFNKTEKVSAENIFLQIDTTTPEVTRKTLKLVATGGGERIVNFPPTVNIGETFRVIPRQENGINVGGNVTLVAYYDTNDANVNVQARCNILIDIPIESATVNLSTEKLIPEQVVTICEQGKPVLEALNIEPLNSLVPYRKSGTLNETIKETLVDKVLYLELVSTGEVPIDKVATLVDAKGVRYPEDEVKIEYEYNENKVLVFKNTIRLKAGTESCDARLNLYAYSTYKDQSKNISGVNISLNKDDAISNVTDFIVGSYVIDNINLFGNTDDNKTIEENVLLNKEIKIYLNNKDASRNDINLNLELKATSSPNAKIGNLEYKNNVYIKIKMSGDREDFNDDFVTLTKSDGTFYDGTSAYGLNINCDGIGDQLSTWYWVLKITDFQAYYKYMTEQKKFVVTLEYYQKDNAQVTSTPSRSFNIIPTINEVNSLSPIYPEGESAFRIKSGETLNIGADNIRIDADGEPTFKQIAYYIDYSENSVNSSTLVRTIPSQAGMYKATFSFNYAGELSENQLDNLEISLNADWATIERDRCQFKKDLNKKGVYLAEVYLTINNSNPPADKIFDIKIDDTIIPITQYMVKFYEKIEESTELSFQSIPYLAIGGIRYYIDFDFVQDGTNKYLKINDETIFDKAFTVSGIGSLVITAQLVYVDENTETIYWLTRRAEDGQNVIPIRTLIHIEVYEELSSLYASNYASEDKYNEYFDKTIFSEDDTGLTQYIFITSNELEALKNYVNYGQVKASVRPYFTGIDVNAYKGIEEINKDAITLGSNFIEVRKNNVIVGYRLAYTINSVHTIEINNAFLDNIFRIEIAIEVNGKTVLATFKMEATENNFLDIKVDDKIITGVELNYTTSGNNGTTTEVPVILKADIDNDGKITYGNWADSLKYFFKYKDTDDKGIIDSMSYGLRILDEGTYTDANLPASDINLNNLYKCNLIFSKKDGLGRGGLEFYNFPIVYKDAESKGVLLEFSVFSIDNNLDFNTHYYYDRTNNRFLRKLNDNLSAKLYFRIFGIEVSIEAKNEINNFVGYEGNTLNVFGNMEDENCIFNIEVKNGNGDVITDKIKDYSQIFTTMLGSNFVSFVEIGKATENKKEYDYSRIIVVKDVLTRNTTTRETISFSFHIGSTSEANQIRIKRGGNFVTTFYQEVKSAFEVTLQEYESGYTSPSQNVKVINAIYKNGDVEITDNIASVTVQVVRESLPTFNGITADVVKVYSGNDEKLFNTLSFITVPYAYNFRLKVSITKTYIEYDENNNPYETYANFEHIFDIFVQPNFVEEDLLIGEYHSAENEEDTSYYYITAGVDGFATFDGNLNLNKANITNINVMFEDLDENNQVLANQHMSYAFNAASSSLRISSRNLNYDKNIKLTITLTFNDGGNYIYTKDIKVLGNMMLEFKDANKEINISAQNNTLNLIDDIYNFIINDVNKNTDFSENVLAEFVYSNPTGVYNKDSFLFDNTIFEDMTPEGKKEHEYYYLRVRYESLEKERQITTNIVFNYLVDNSYTLVFNLELKINIIGSVVLSLVDGEKVLNINDKSEAINLIDETLYNFTINDVSQKDRFKTEILGKFDYNAISKKYNKNSFIFDNNIFEDVTIVAEEENSEIINRFLLKVKYDTLDKDKQYKTTIRFKYIKEAVLTDSLEKDKIIEFELNFTLNLLGTVKLSLNEGSKTLNINSESEAINLIDASLYNFTINNSLQNERFNDEVLAVFDYNNLDADYNKNSFEFDGNIFEDVTITDGDGTLTGVNNMFLKVKYDELEKGKAINTVITFKYKSLTGTLIFSLYLTINVENV